ncbi:unnamed protein product [Rotaria sp. Silwood1]|nr:unnamed protein product [Rotaria sp. Silwood1]CAF1410930.1 unnamed protein product [Rotaria sp. Silwood1]
MDQIKRKLTFNQLSKEETKKLRNEFNQSITCIENLSNEFFYEIFDYLDGYDIYTAFSYLNQRFQKLLNSSSLLFKITLDDSIYNESYISSYKQYLHLNRHKIFSIDLCSIIKNNSISWLTFDSSLMCLESLSIRQKLDNLISILLNLAYLPRLFYLTIDISNNSKNINDIYQLIFTLPILKSLIIRSGHYIKISLPMVTNQRLSTIEYLSIDHSWTYNELFSITSYTPQLRRLQLCNAYDFHRNIQTILPNKLLKLTDISIPTDSLKFHEFEIYIRKIDAKLKVLRVTVQSQDITFLNAYRWEKLILESFSQLEQFYLRYIEWFDKKYQYPGGPNQFISSFWIEKKWIFEIEINHESIDYSIRPYRKRWYEDTQDKNFNSSVEYSKSARLIITFIDNHDFEETTIMSITYILTVAQIYHLEISEENVHVGVLIGVVSLLSELTTLKIHSLSLHVPRMLNSEEIHTLSSIEDTSKVTKVYLEIMYNIEDFYFLLELCPYMEYCKVNSIKRIDYRFVLRYIFKKIKDDCNDHLRLLCFRIPTADDEMIKKLKRMINFEKLLFNYTIKRVADYLYFQW